MYSYQKVSSHEARSLTDAVVTEVDEIDKQAGEFMLNFNRPPAFWGDNGITGFGGGVTIRNNNSTIGGIGVSGLSEEEDERIANAAITKVYG